MRELTVTLIPEAPINNIIKLSDTFKPHLGIEVRIISPSAMEKLAQDNNDSGWKGVAGIFPIQVNSHIEEQKFIFLTRELSRAQVAHEVGHAVMGHMPLPIRSWREGLTHELEAWKWSFTKKRYRENKKDKWNDFAFIVCHYMNSSGASVKIAVREARVVLNRIGEVVPKDAWDKIIPC